MTDQGSLLEVSQICAGYGKLDVLRDVSLQVRSGEIVALLGPNGAGKTTLLGAISGLVRDIRSGTVVFDGKDITRSKPRATVRAGLLQVIEGHRVFANMTVDENVRLGGFGLRPASRERGVERAYDNFPELVDKRSLKAGQLSGGQQQMLVVAQALVRAPKLLMLDEPSAGLAPVLVDRILNVARDLATDGVAVVIVEQLVDKVLAVSDRAYVLVQGSITYAGDVSDLIEQDHLKHAYLG